ncbi:Uncharacterised protein [Legionella beliardensis]|uniref:Uncharacterized protein n=1 Tax=Legionella beliardensis TaxID=91822 RepID=A0A378I4X1_9GAMM|nr:hypothetical protein [Legionella beliardensis]STX29746.1 Uncharacterised protein [Legionella beliardensis]
MDSFSYDTYKRLIKDLMKVMPLIDFADVQDHDERFFLLRHDVEFSIEKAFAMAKLEHEKMGISSSYFFQIRNDSYNPLSYRSKELIQNIHAMGHKIGLHVNTGSQKDFSQITSSVKQDVELLQNGLGIAIDRFSWHRPSHELLKKNIKIKGLINTYDKRFFHFYGNKPQDILKIYYYSDSEHIWKYGDPLNILHKPVKKMQLLIHPYSWSKQGYDNETNFKTIIAEKYHLMRQAMNSECHHFPQEFLPKNVCLCNIKTQDN